MLAGRDLLLRQYGCQATRTHRPVLVTSRPTIRAVCHPCGVRPAARRERICGDRRA